MRINKEDKIRTTITLEKEIVDELMYRTKTKSKASAVREAINEYIRQDKIKKIRAKKGKLAFDMTAEEIRYSER